MDTANIMDMVLGAVSMSFVLSIDEIIYETITASPTKHIMEDLYDHAQVSGDEHQRSPRPMYEASPPSQERSNSRTLASDVVLEGQGVDMPKQVASWRLLFILLPRRLTLVVIIMSLYML